VGSGRAALLAGATPLTPDGDEAREWAERELTDPVYAAAEPTLLDRVARAIGDFLARLFSGQLPAEWGPLLAVVAAAVAVILIVVAILVWGVPRPTGRTAAKRELFGEAEKRSAAELRNAAASHAAREEWDAAIIVRVRALARSAAERGFVQTPPGATVHAFARAAGRVFPDYAGALEDTATIFDDVRYLRRPGSADLYSRVARVDDGIAASRPAELAGAPS